LVAFANTRRFAHPIRAGEISLALAAGVESMSRSGWAPLEWVRRADRKPFEEVARRL
jgi:acetyl-CoA acetyltransferase